MVKFVKLLKNNKGATAIEYGLIAALIAVAAIGAMTNIGTKLSSTFNNVSTSLTYSFPSVGGAAAPIGAAAFLLPSSDHNSPRVEGNWPLTMRLTDMVSNWATKIFL
jgi:pilus assembly protein Flp/PilA